jgi:hypothetical protein
MSNRSWSVALVVVGLVTLVVMGVGVALAELPPGGTFIDDDGNIHEGNIEAIAAEGITKGCNPQVNNKYCPDKSLTRGQMAAFVRRALSLPSSSTDFFVDDDGSVFEDDINAIAAEGITKGCNPPVNDKFCPDGKIGRDQMAAFLRRAFEYPNVETDYFVDDDGSIFEADINAIAAVGVTKGCNPPTNDRYCPDNLVRRDQMASFFARSLGLTPIIPPTPSDGVWSPGPGMTWQWQLDGVIDTSVDAEMFDVDLFETPVSVVDELRSGGRAVVCYLSAGSWEEFRPDAGLFPDEVKGTSNGWPGEKWLDIHRLDVLGPIMESRLDLCRDKGFVGVEFDNIDGFSNNTGFALTAGDQTTYNVFLAEAAHARGLAAGFKNNVDQAAAQEPFFDFTVNEECFVYDECGALSVFIDAGKAVFHVEYDVATPKFCPVVNALGFSSMRKNLDLDAWRDTCW